MSIHTHDKTEAIMERQGTKTIQSVLNAGIINEEDFELEVIPPKIDSKWWRVTATLRSGLIIADYQFMPSKGEMLPKEIKCQVFF